MDQKYKLFYKPIDGFAADFIPFYENGTYYLFYLHDYRNIAEKGEGTPWYLITTTDFVNFKEYGEILQRGTEEDQDLFDFTGCVFKKGDNDYFMFYTGHNPHFTDKPVEVILLARSKDLIHWEKQKDFQFKADINSYYPNDWRDPFVYFDKDANEYKMLLASRLKKGDNRRGGATLCCKSKDLLTWEVDSPLWYPNQYFTHECPDLFTLGNKKYLCFSEFSSKRVTQYRMLDKNDLVIPTNCDCRFDGRAYYAAKTAGTENKRYTFGWVPTKENNEDYGYWQWGGNLAVHEIYKGKDNAIYERMPETIRSSFNKIKFENKMINLAGSQVNDYEIIDKIDDCLLISFDVTNISNVNMLGLRLIANKEEDMSYFVGVDNQDNKLFFDRFPSDEWRFSNFVGLNRNINYKNKHHFDILIDDDVIVTYLDNAYALSSRVCCKLTSIKASIVEGSAIFKNLVIRGK